MLSGLLTKLAVIVPGPLMTAVVAADVGVLMVIWPVQFHDVNWYLVFGVHEMLNAPAAVTHAVGDDIVPAFVGLTVIVTRYSVSQFAVTVFG